MARDKIIIKGAREHNLKNVNLQLPRNKLIVMTGISGSGKSSLAFDTIYAEGQRRYVESLSAYARQFLGQLQKPDVDEIEGLSPAISIDQKSSSKNPRSTVGTVTEIYDYLRLLYARIGEVHCYQCGKKISRQTPQQIISQVIQLPSQTRFLILAPVVKGRKGEFKQLLLKLRKQGFVRVQVDGEIYRLDEDINLDRNQRHDLEVVVDRLMIKPGIKTRLADSIELALKLADGIVSIAILEQKGQSGSGKTVKQVLTFSEHFACLDCGISFSELEPRMFSFNSPYGACEHCSGLGAIREVDPELAVPNPDLSLAEGAIAPWHGFKMTYYPRLLEALCRSANIDYFQPFKKLSEEEKRLILYGQPPTETVINWGDMEGNVHSHYALFEGVIPNLMRRYRETKSDYARDKIEQYMRIITCPACRGARLKPASLAVTLEGMNIIEFTKLPIDKSLQFISELGGKLSSSKLNIADRLIKEIRDRLKFLVDVGLDYLTLDRSASSLAGGEAQRIRLATQIGSGLMGVIYILDEPSIGLHQRDNRRLLSTLEHLRDLGNTLIVVEHDEETIRRADYIVDIGPGAGEHGGEVVATGTVADICAQPKSLTGRYLSGLESIPVPKSRISGNGKVLVIKGAREHNLKNIDVVFPLGRLICVTGVSGSGKSSLVSDILATALKSRFYKSNQKPGKHQGLLGVEEIDKVVEITQSPIGRTPRSNPATYTGLFTDIRAVFSQTREARARGYRPGRFSFNVKGGRCEACQGEGQIKIEMHFLPDVYVTCEDCKGSRYNQETLEIQFKGKNIAEVLSMSVDQAMEFFAKIPKVRKRLQTLSDVGLGYIKLGQSAPTLSGGEAQRVKLATELAKVATGRTLYILDEPTTGLHFADVHKLLKVLKRLVSAGNTVIVIEHNLDVIKTADYLIDLGPEGGDKGGEIVATGTPEKVAQNQRSYTGRYLAKVLH